MSGNNNNNDQQKKKTRTTKVKPGEKKPKVKTPDEVRESIRTGVPLYQDDDGD